MGATQSSNQDGNQPRDSVAARPLRRAVEFFASLFARRKMNRFVRRLTSRVRDSLGATNTPRGAPTLVRVRASAAAMRTLEKRRPFGR